MKRKYNQIFFKSDDVCFVASSCLCQKYVINAPAKKEKKNWKWNKNSQNDDDDDDEGRQ